MIFFRCVHCLESEAGSWSRTGDAIWDAPLIFHVEPEKIKTLKMEIPIGNRNTSEIQHG